MYRVVGMRTGLGAIGAASGDGLDSWSAGVTWGTFCDCELRTPGSCVDEEGASPLSLGFESRKPRRIPAYMVGVGEEESLGPRNDQSGVYMRMRGEGSQIRTRASLAVRGPMQIAARQVCIDDPPLEETKLLDLSWPGAGAASVLGFDPLRRTFSRNRQTQ